MIYFISMSTFGERLKGLLERERIRNSALAEDLGVSRSAVTKWIKDEAEPRSELIKMISKRLNTSISYLRGEDNIDYDRPLKTSYISAYSDILPSLIYCLEEPEEIKGFIWVPVYETKISTTPGIQDIIRDDIIGWHTAPESLTSDDPYMRPFSMKVIGDSMSPFILPNDYLTIKPAPFIIPNSQSIYAVKIADDLTDTYGIVVKRVQYIASKELYLLRSDNSDYPIYIIESEKAMIIGRIINLWRIF